MAGLAKGFLFHWVGKQMKLIPQFNAVPDGPHRFNYQAKIDGINYTAFGGGTSKKEGEAAAARDLLNYLVDNEIIPVDAVPPNMLTPNSTVEVKKSSESVSLKNKVPPQGRSENVPAKKLKLEETNVDADAHLHGNWTLLNAKTKLHQFLNENKIPADFIYYCEGPDHQRLFRAELSFWLKEAHRNIVGNEAAHSKKLAAQYCSRSLVRQLYHMGIIPAAEPGQIGLKKKPQPAVPIWKVALSPEIEKQMQSILQISKIEPVQEPNFGEKINLHVPMSYCISDNNDEVQTVSWEPPSLNWNPWLAQSVLFEGEEGERLAQSGSLIYDEFQAKWDDNNFVSMLEQRKMLPVYKYKQQIIELVNENQVVIIRGATGCGKTTQVPQYILDDFILKSAGDQCNIVVTQPRRISATSVAERVAAERAEFLGNSIGYSVRFDTLLPRSHGSILFCTTGVLLRRMENGLTGISHIFVDEIHERDINSDFLLIILREMVSVFPNLRVILMSATIDTNIFSQYFNNCPVVEVDGFLHPVQEYFLEDVIQLIGYNPPIADKKKKKGSEIQEEMNMNTVCGAEYTVQTKNAMAQIPETEISIGLIVSLLLHISSLEKPGAVLIFLPGWNVIFKLLGHLQQHHIFGSQKYLLIPLHSQIPRADQGKVFKPAPNGVQKIILSTNIAETSITIDDVVFVIDACKAKVKQFTSHNNMNNYSTVWASQSNLDQRKGRAGRVQPGFCFHLVSKARYQKLAKYMIPEILRTPLHILVLSIKLLKLGKVVDILNKAMEPPAMDAVFDSLELLKEMNALEGNEVLTPLGYILSKLPIEPKLGKMIILGCILNVGDAVCTIAASMCFLGPFEKSVESKNEWAPKRFAGSMNSDHLAMLWAYQQWEDAKAAGVPAEERFCRTNELNLQVLRMTADAKQQLKELLSVLGFPEESMLSHKFNYKGTDDQLDLVTGVLCVGLYPNICMHQEKRKVITTEGKYALIHKSSVVCSSDKAFYPSPFFIYGEKNRTHVVCCKQLTMIYPVQYLLFTPCKTEACHQAVNIDEWLEIKMSFQQAAILVAFRNVVENLIAQVSYDPKTIYTLSSQDNEIIKLLAVLSRSESGSYMIESQSYGKKKETYSIGNFDAKNSFFQVRGTTSNPPLQFQQNKRQQGYQEPRQNNLRQSNRGRGFGRVDGGFRKDVGGERGFGAGNRSFRGADSGFVGSDRGFGGSDRGFGGSDRGFGGGNRGFGGSNRGLGESNRSFGGSNRGFEGSNRGFGGSNRGFGGSNRGFGGERSFYGEDRSFGEGEQGFRGEDRDFEGGNRGFGGGGRSFGGVDTGFGLGERLDTGFGSGFGSVEESFQRNGERGFGRAERGFGRGEGGFWRGYSSW